MGKCNMCGKKGLFLRINEFGRCKACQTEVESKLLQDAQNYFNQLVSVFDNIKSEVETSDDPIERLNDLPLFEKKVALCDEMLNLLQNYKSFEYLKQIWDDNITYDSEHDKNFLHYGRIKPLSLSFFVNHGDYFNSSIQKLNDTVLMYKNGWKKTIERLHSDAHFQKMLLNLENYNIEHKNSDIIKLSVDDLYSNKFSTITSRSNYDKLGKFVVIDTETTGLNCSYNEIIEIAAVYFEDWKPMLKFETLIHPRKKIPYNITALTSITNEMVEDSPYFGQVVDSLHNFVGKNNLVGHNLTFDLKFLYKNGYNFLDQKRKYFDTLSLAKKALKTYGLDNYKLPTLCDYYGIRDNESSHRALSDALATGLLFKELSFQIIY